MDENCIFCKIINKEIPSTMVYEDEYVCAFKDLNPVAPVHVLVIPKIHIQDLEHVNEENSIYVSKVQEAFKKVSEDGGQEVKHLHYHLIGGKKLGAKIIHD